MLCCSDPLSVLLALSVCVLVRAYSVWCVYVVGVVCMVVLVYTVYILCWWDLSGLLPVMTW